MPKTSDEINIILRELNFEVEQEDRFANTKEDFDKAYDNWDLFKNQVWFSEQELKNKLKEAEKRIDEKLTDYFNKMEAKTILNDCFGCGK